MANIRTSNTRHARAQTRAVKLAQRTRLALKNGDPVPTVHRHRSLAAMEAAVAAKTAT